MDLKRTGTFRMPTTVIKTRSDAAPDASAVLLAGLATPGALLDRNGIVQFLNPAFAEMLGVAAQRVQGEPILSFMQRAGEREAFGREFLDFRQRQVGQAFVRDLDFRVERGRAASHIRVSLRACKIGDGRILVTCERARVGDAQAELGRAVNRALDTLDQGVFLLGGDGRVVHANPSARGLIGESVLGRGFLEFVAPRRVEQIARALDLARAGSWRGEVEMQSLEGEPIPVEISIAGGSGIGAPVVVFCRDLRAQRQKEFEDRLINQLDRALVSSAEPREALTAACQTLVRGLSAQKCVLLTPFSAQWSRLEVAADGSPRLIVLDRSVRPAPSWAREREVVVDPNILAAPQRCVGEFSEGAKVCRFALRAPGSVVGYLLLAREQRFDWSEHEQALIAQLGSQLALGLANGLLTLETRALVAYQARVLDQTAVLLNSVDAEGRVVTWNRASEQLVGVSADAAKGRLFGIDVAPAAVPERWQALWNQLRSDGMVTSEIVFKDSEDNPVPVHLEGRLLRDGAEVLGAVFVGLDLRVRRALEAQVLQSQKMAAVGLMAAGIAHEINNPLTGVVGYSKLLLENRTLTPDIRRKVEHISVSGERCRKIVEGVLLFSRQQGDVERAPLNLADLINRVVRIGEYQWKMHNVRILRDLEPEVVVMVDADQIEQVLLNLLSNAVDAMGTGGNIEIALRAQDSGGAILSVRDEGCGIPPEARDHIFDPFFSTKDIGKGTGLGLSISYGIVRDHGGDILVESSPGAGTTFIVMLPEGSPAPAPSDSASGLRLPLSPKSPKKSPRKGAPPLARPVSTYLRAPEGKANSSSGQAPSGQRPSGQAPSGQPGSPASPRPSDSEPSTSRPAKSDPKSS